MGILKRLTSCAKIFCIITKISKLVCVCFIFAFELSIIHAILFFLQYCICIYVFYFRYSMGLFSLSSSQRKIFFVLFTHFPLTLNTIFSGRIVLVKVRLRLCKYTVTRLTENILAFVELLNIWNGTDSEQNLERKYETLKLKPINALKPTILFLFIALIWLKSHF